MCARTIAAPCGGGSDDDCGGLTRSFRPASPFLQAQQHTDGGALSGKKKHAVGSLRRVGRRPTRRILTEEKHPFIKSPLWKVLSTPPLYLPLVLPSPPSSLAEHHWLQVQLLPNHIKTFQKVKGEKKVVFNYSFNNNNNKKFE